MKKQGSIYSFPIGQKNFPNFLQLALKLGEQKLRLSCRRDEMISMGNKQRGVMMNTLDCVETLSKGRAWAWAGQPGTMLARVAESRAIGEATGVDLSAVKIVDAPPETFTRAAHVQIEYADILNGIPGNVWIDPVGHAVKRAIPFSRNVRVSTVDIAFTVGRPVAGGLVEHKRYVVETPAEVVAWIQRFDAKKTVWPMAFGLTWTEEV